MVTRLSGVARIRAVVASVGVGVVLLCFTDSCGTAAEVAEKDSIFWGREPRASLGVHLMIVRSWLGVFVYVVEHTVVTRLSDK